MATAMNERNLGIIQAVGAIFALWSVTQADRMDWAIIALALVMFSMAWHHVAGTVGK